MTEALRLRRAAKPWRRSELSDPLRLQFTQRPRVLRALLSLQLHLGLVLLRERPSRFPPWTPSSIKRKKDREVQGFTFGGCPQDRGSDARLLRRVVCLWPGSGFLRLAFKPVQAY